MNKVVSGGAKLVKAAEGVSDADEMKIGREVAANLAARYGYVEDPAQVRYINLIGQTIARQCNRSNIPYHFAILKTKDVNALAAPGGYIFVTQGLLDRLQDESELAGVLAHEINHVVQRHIVKAMRKADLLGAGVDFASAGSKSLAQLSQVSDFSITMLSNGLSRKDELEADQLGTALAAKVGYNALGLRNSIKRLGEETGKTSALEQFNKTHPPTDDRLNAIDDVINKNHLTDTGPHLADRFRKYFPKPA